MFFRTSGLKTARGSINCPEVTERSSPDTCTHLRNSFFVILPLEKGYCGIGGVSLF